MFEFEFEVRQGRDKAQGRRRLTAERAAYLQLVSEGVSSREASRIVGINPRTGKRWRNGRPAWQGRQAVAPITMPAPVGGPSRFLTEAERIEIADRRWAGESLRVIAAALGRSPSTISRELRRNAHPDSGDYRPHAAHARATARLPRPKTSKIASDPDLRAYIAAKLKLRWSPAQICQALRKDFPDRPEWHVVHETIYQALYVQGRGELRREIARALRTGRAARRPQRRADARTPRNNMVMISERPAEVADRAVPGHWEGDLILGTWNTSAIGTLVERTTRYVMLLHLGAGKTAEHVRDALTQAVQTLPAHLVKSLTWDQGAEMARHAEFTIATDIPVYFCDPHSPWQRGSNENTNGLLRQYFPKGTDLSVHSPEHLAAVAAELNGRPRQTLNWDTPAERLAKLLTI